MYCQAENNRHLFQININYDERTDWHAEVKNESGEPMGFKYKIRNFEGLGALRVTRDAILLNDAVNGEVTMAMALDHNAVESAVKYFFDHWYRGLQPSLTPETFPNGDVSIQMKVIIPAAIVKHENTSCNKQHRAKRSGKESRKRRKKRRQYDSSN